MSLKAVLVVLQVGLASWYGPGFQGHKTASGEVYDEEQLTAASQTLPLNSRVTVENLTNHKTVTVRINDRGPFVNHRVIDLSWKAAYYLDMLDGGVAKVRIYKTKQT